MAKSGSQEERLSVSENAFRRLLALRKAELNAAERLRAGDDYPDFFVEGSGPPWHEMWPEVALGGDVIDPASVQQRIRALRGLNVIQAFLNMRAGAEK